MHIWRSGYKAYSLTEVNAVYIETKAAQHTIAHIVVAAYTHVQLFVWMLPGYAPHHLKFLKTVNVIGAACQQEALELLHVLNRTVPDYSAGTHA